MRSVGNRLKDDDEGGSQSSDSTKAIDWTPFEMEFEMTEAELAGLQDAFTRYMDAKEKTISFNELFHDLKAIDIQRKQPLLYEILDRIVDFPEIQGEGNDRIDYETFMRLITKSLSMRNTKQ